MTTDEWGREKRPFFLLVDKHSKITTILVMATRSTNAGLGSDFRPQGSFSYGTGIAAQVEAGIDKAHKNRVGADSYAKSLSSESLAKAYEATSREYDRMSRGADEFDKENPEAGNFGSADSYVRMGADSYHDTYYKPIINELSRRWLNTDGKPFWLESSEQKKYKSQGVQYGGEKPWDKLQYYMNYEVSPSVSISMQRDVSRGSGSKVDFSGVSDEIIARSVKIAEQGLDEIRRESIERDKKIGKDNYYESNYPKDWKENILDPLVNELNRRKNK